MKKALARNDNNVEESINDLLEKNPNNQRQLTPKELKERKERKSRGQPNKQIPSEINNKKPPKKIQQPQKEAPSLPLPMTKTHIYQYYGINPDEIPLNGISLDQGSLNAIISENKGSFEPPNLSSKFTRKHYYVPKEGDKKLYKV